MKPRSEGFTCKHKPLREKYFSRSKYFANIEDHDRERVCPGIQWVTWSTELNSGQDECNILHSRHGLNPERVHLTVEKKLSITCGENQTFFSQTKNRTVELFNNHTLLRKYILDVQSFTEYILANFYEKHAWTRWQVTIKKVQDTERQETCLLPRDAGTLVGQEGGSKIVEGNGNLQKTKKSLPTILATVKQHC